MGKKESKNNKDDIIYKEAVSKYKDRLTKIVENQNDKFDQTIIYIAGGAFAISAVVIDKVVILNKAVYKIHLVLALSIFASVVVLALIAHFISFKANSWALDNIGEVEDDLFSKVRNRCNFVIEFINYATIVLLILGCIFLLYFIKINV